MTSISESIGFDIGYIGQLQTENLLLRGKIEELNIIATNLQQQVAKLSEPPLILANVIEIIDKGRVVIRTAPAGPCFIVNVPDNEFSLAPGDRVAMPSNGFTISEKLTEETDEIANAMQVVLKPDVTFAEIGGLGSIVQDIKDVIELPLLRPEVFREIGIEAPKGVLLYGPPGTGKTMIAKAIANETNSCFIKITASELARKYIGEGAKLVRNIFKLAKKNAPTIIFLDEIDAIASNRMDANTVGDREVQRTLMQLLAEIDGFDSLENVRIVAATNRIDILDSALLRPGRFDRIIEIPFPDHVARKEIFNVYVSRMKISGDVKIDRLINDSEGLSGADIKSVCTEAGLKAIRENRNSVNPGDFEYAIKKVLDNAEDENTKEVNAKMYA
ncbi:MAG: proteasome-activating nucleotidase [Candidatus Altiarchaeales archaeon HGW-Altiarchaeales-3]|nr:MAG: proteasome-activating nucleotidase [Candidatus Altiarchaeales archaeon HGW-Altiarchaeales-3]